MRKSLIFFVISLPAIVFAKPSALFEQAVKKYQKAKMVTMKVEKSVVSDLLGKETIYDGQIQLSSGKFRWENETPEKTLLLFDGQTLFNVQYPSKEFKGKVQVGKTKIDEKSRKQILVSSLLSPGTTPSKFTVVSETKGKDLIEFEVKPETEDLQIKNLTVGIDSKTKKIHLISYKDDVGNLTKMAFSDIKFQSKADPKIFQYKIPKDAQVTNL
jgi:outer membrane lipoprotein carrier protein